MRQGNPDEKSVISNTFNWKKVRDDRKIKRVQTKYI
jgi:hypothetical protein